MRETKADLIRARDEYREQALVEHMANRFLVLSVKPDFEETVRWRDKHGGDFVVTLRGYGLARGDGGVVIQIWGELHDSPNALLERERCSLQGAQAERQVSLRHLPDVP